MVLKKLLSFLINFTIFFLIVTFSPGLGPKTAFDFEAFTAGDIKPLEGALKLNTRLNHAERLYEGKVLAPEHLLERDGIIYVAVKNNQVVKIENGEIKVVTSFGRSCYDEDNYETFPCGRPLGMAFDPLDENNLIVIHSYLGLFEVNIKTGQKKLLASNEEVIGKDNPRPSRFFNSVAVAKNGDIYFTHSSSNADIDKILQSMLLNPDGRVIHYERSSGKQRVLMDKVYFANGIVLSPNEDFLVVAETAAAKLHKIWLKGEKAGKSELFTGGLPGSPDNLTTNKKGILATLTNAIDSSHPSLTHFFAPYPIFRRFAYRFLELLLMPFRFINSVYPNYITNTFVREFGSMHQLKYIFSPRRTVVLVDWNGNIVTSYHGSDGTLGGITHAMQVDDYLYLGSVTENYIGRVQLKDD